MQTIQEIINSSGYPLQIRLEKLIEETKDDHGWRVLVDEHRWCNPSTKDEGYIDLILHHTGINLRLVIECKRFKGSWLFLLPGSLPQKTENIRLLSNNNLNDSLLWEDCSLGPESFESKYCIMETQGKKDDRTLEKIAGGLLISMEQLADEDVKLINLRYARESEKSFSPPPMFYIPLIVTTANLIPVIFDPSDIDMENGEIILNEGSTNSVDYIRFRKNLATNMSYYDPYVNNLHDLNHEYDRTLFIVHADKFLGLLKLLTNLI
jgi:hypothetical protein